MAQTYQINVQPDTILNEEMKPLLELPDSRDSLSTVLAIAKLIKELQNRSFLEASADHIHFTDSNVFVQLHLGPLYKFAKLNIPEESRKIFRNSGYRTDQFEGKVLNVNQINMLIVDLLTELEQSGYPFAQISFSDYQFQDGLFNGTLNIEKGNYFQFDTLNLYDLDFVSKNFLSNYLDIRLGDPFNMKKFQSISQKIENLPFLKLSEDPGLSFQGSSAIVNLKLEERIASRFDFILGILPGSGERRYTISGDLNVEVMNELGQGEQFFLRYERLKPQTQSLRSTFRYPYLFSLPFGLEGEFNFFRNEALNRDLDFSFGFLYQLSTNNFLKAFWNTTSSRLIEIDTIALKSSLSLPNRLDVRSNGLGFEWQVQRLDYLFNPRKGYQGHIRFRASEKSILPNNQILNFRTTGADFSNAYDSLDLSAFQFSIDFGWDQYLPIFERSALLGSIDISAILSNQEIYENEYYRIGGNQFLRGFDEESINADFFALLSLEYRFLLSRNSFVSFFGDYAFRRNQYDPQYEWDQPYGIGAGFSLETAAGIFGINVAIGAEKNNPLDLRNTKTHMGFLSLF